MEEACAGTSSLCCAAAGWSVTLISRAELTVTLTVELASAKPLARTVTVYAPGNKSVKRNSPRLSLLVWRSSEDSVACSRTSADWTRPPLESKVHQRRLI